MIAWKPLRTVSTDGDKVVGLIVQVVQCAEVRRRVASLASLYSPNDSTINGGALPKGEVRHLRFNTVNGYT